MKKILIISLVIFLAVTTSVYAAGKGFPKRNITNAVVWGAGGGTDTCNRIITAEMAKFLGVNINARKCLENICRQLLNHKNKPTIRKPITLRKNSIWKVLN